MASVRRHTPSSIVFVASSGVVGRPPLATSLARRSKLATTLGDRNTVPALLTRISRLSQTVRKRVYIFSTARPSATSAGTPIARPPAAVISSTTLCAASSRMSLIATIAPSRANSSAIARPIPEPAPVTRATLPSSVMPLSSIRLHVEQVVDEPSAHCHVEPDRQRDAGKTAVGDEIAPAQRQIEQTQDQGHQHDRQQDVRDQRREVDAPP